MLRASHPSLTGTSGFTAVSIVLQQLGPALSCCQTSNLAVEAVVATFAVQCASCHPQSSGAHSSVV